MVRAVQQARRDAGLQVSDRIVLTLGGDAAVRTAIQTHSELISGETLAAELVVGDAEAETVAVGDGQRVTIGVSRATT